MGKGWKGPGEGQRKMELIGRILVLSESEYGILEREQGAGIDLKGEVKVERASAAILRVELDFPDLTKGVGLNEMALVVNMETMVNGVILEVGHVSGYIDNCHRTASLPVLVRLQ